MGLIWDFIFHCNPKTLQSLKPLALSVADTQKIMKGGKRRPSNPAKARTNGKKRFSSIADDSFFEATDQKRRRKFENDEEIKSSDEDGGDSDSEKEEEIDETPAEKRKRLADAFLEKLRAKEREREENEESEEEGEGRREREGERDTLIAKILQQDQLEESGRVRRALASRFVSFSAQFGMLK